MSKCWYCNNELTTGDNPNHFGICNKCYDEMFKSGDTIIRNLTDKIAELQKQLEETKQTGSYQVMLMCQKENILLKQQLKNQPKEIIEKIKKWGQKHYNWVGDGTGYDGQNYNECIGFNMAIDQLNEILDAILNGVSYD